MRFYSFTSYTRLWLLLTDLIDSPFAYRVLVCCLLFLLDRCLSRKLEVLFVFHRRNRPSGVDEHLSGHDGFCLPSLFRFNGPMDLCYYGLTDGTTRKPSDRETVDHLYIVRGSGWKVVDASNRSLPCGIGKAQVRNF